MFYEDLRTGLGEALIGEVDRQLERLRAFPEVGSPVGGGLRRTLLDGFPFQLIYAVENRAIVVVAVAHQSRRPGFWAGRKP